MGHPYSNLPPERFWRSSVASQDWASLGGLYRKKFDIGKDDKVATAGSCFAQHIATAMRANGYQVPNSEPTPTGLSAETARKYGYGIYSARYGNIYVVRHLLQLLKDAFDDNAEVEVWEKDGRFFDAMRPTLEPRGHATPDEVVAHRRYHLSRVRRLVRTMNVFVFTFGLTEGWMNRQSGRVYPTCPGTAAGTFDPDLHIFKNFTFQEILADFIACRDFIKRTNKSVRFLVTVSPVPLVATAGDDHVLVATTYSKSVLRAVAGQLAEQFDDLAYFPPTKSSPARGRAACSTCPTCATSPRRAWKP